MAFLGPWDDGRRVAVAVSGGADSMALALLAAGWGDPLALIVDHGLRPDSAEEARTVARRLADRRIPARVLTLSGLLRGPGLAARARQARYAALDAACREAGLVDLLLGHHAADQAETVLMRRNRASGPSGLAGMASVMSTGTVRRVRPLLPFAPERLRALLRREDVPWVEDPSNADPAAGRTAARAAAAHQVVALSEAAVQAGLRRARTEAAVAAELARRVQLFPAGFAILSPGPIGTDSLAALIRSVSGAQYLPHDADGLAACPRPATLGGTRLLPAGRLGPGWLLVREPRAMALPVPARDGQVWDGRFRVAGTAPPGCTLGALGEDYRQFRKHTQWGAAILRTLPALRDAHGMLCSVPHLAYAPFGVRFGGLDVRPAGMPACCASFTA